MDGIIELLKMKILFRSSGVHLEWKECGLGCRALDCYLIEIVGNNLKLICLVP